MLRRNGWRGKVVTELLFWGGRTGGLYWLAAVLVSQPATVPLCRCIC